MKRIRNMLCENHVACNLESLDYLILQIHVRSLNTIRDPPTSTTNSGIVGFEGPGKRYATTMTILHLCCSFAPRTDPNVTVAYAMISLEAAARERYRLGKCSFVTL